VARVVDWEAEVAKHPRDRLTFSDSTSDRVAAYFHTGGTTGMPKVAQHTYEGMIYNGWVGHTLLFTEEDNVICPLPLFHVFACHVILMAMVASGGHVIFPTPQGYRGEGVFDNFWKLVERWKVTFIITVPTAIAAMMQRPVNADVSSVKTAFSGSAPLPVELFRRFEKATGVTLGRRLWPDRGDVPGVLQPGRRGEKDRLRRYPLSALQCPDPETDALGANLLRRG
jgi:acyl-CoA synthetase (AMP-forming)/AMP-acid ligase II